MIIHSAPNATTKITRGPPKLWTLRRRGPLRRLLPVPASPCSTAEAPSERPTECRPQIQRAAVASAAACEAHTSTTVGIPSPVADGGRSCCKDSSVRGCSSSPTWAMGRLRSFLQWSSCCRNYHRAWAVAGSQALPGQLIHTRLFSIMDRYNKVLQKDSSCAQARSDLGFSPPLPATAPAVDTPQPAISYGSVDPTASSFVPPSRPSLPRPIARDPVPSEAQFATWQPPLQPEHPRSLTIALIGPPNAGKSSLLNAFLGVTVSAVSNKVNTTRTDFRGMVTKGNCQLVFVDAPGIIESHPKKTFCRELVNAAWRGYEDADLGILVIDTVKRPTQQIFNVVRSIAPKPCLSRFGFHHAGVSQLQDPITRSHEALTSGIVCSPSLEEMREAGIPGTVRHRLAMTHRDGEADGHSPTIPIVLCLNKIDLASHPKWIRAREREFQSHGLFQRVFHVSAKHRRGTQSLLDYLITEAVPRSWSFPPDMRTSLSKVEQIEQLIRTYLFCWFNKDVPYRTSQQTVGWSYQEDGSVAIQQELVVRTAQVAKMICGVRGRILLQMRKNVTYKLEQLWGCKVHLNIYVRVSRS